MTVVVNKPALNQLLMMLVLLIMCASSVSAAGGRDPYVYFFDETWGNFQEEVEKAKEMGKKGILIFFEMDECPFCHRMKQTVLNQPEVQAYYKKNFLNISVDIEGDVEVTNFQGVEMKQKDFAFKINRVRATPVFAFYDLEGNQIVRYTGATNGVQEFLWLGEFVVQGNYEKMRFAKYKRQRKKAIRSKL